MKELQWGETPWDDWTRDQLLREMQRMYSACLSMRSALSLDKDQTGGNANPYWQPGGTGWRALAKGCQVLDQYDEQEEDIYRSFFRYADCLLFVGIAPLWRICDQGHMWGCAYRDSPSDSCAICKGTLRRIVWSDLDPKAHTVSK